MKGELTVSGLYEANAGGIFVSYTVGGEATPDEISRRIHLMIYQLASYMNAKNQSANILNAAKQALGGEPQPGEISVTSADSGPITGYFATDLSLSSNGEYHVYAAGIDPAQTYDTQSGPNLYYVMDLQDLSLVLSILQLSTADNQAADQRIFQAALAALKAISDQLEERVERQGWGEAQRHR